MSATNRGAVRVEGDYYPTPEWCTKLIIDRIDWEVAGSMHEPCKGEGAILDLVPDGITKSWCEISEGFDYFKTPVPNVDLSLSNPPFNIATPFVEKALSHSLCVTYLLRINYLESEERKAFLSANSPTHLYVLSKRPSFVDVCTGFTKPEKKKGCGWAFQKKAEVKTCPNCGGKVKAGTDATGYAWFCWDHGGIMRDMPGIYFL